jgi:hypothetical protein
MNERIKQLMDQAGIDVEVVENLGEMPTALKFAELIVRECATMCINEGRAHDQWFGSHCAIAVKEHFGVE